MKTFAEAGSAGASQISSAATVPVKIVGGTLSKIGSAIVSVTPNPVRVVVSLAWSYMPDLNSPFVVVIMMVQFASDIQWYKRMGRLLWRMLTGKGRDAACDFCDEVRIQKIYHASRRNSRTKHDTCSKS